MTDNTKISSDTDDDTEVALCRACAADYAWRIVAALAEPYGGLESKGWAAEMEAANPELMAAVDDLLGPLLALENPEHEGGGATDEPSAVVH